MCATRAVFVLFLAVVAVAVAAAIPAAIPQSSVNAPSAIEPRQPLENHEIGPLSEAAEPNQDLKGSSSYGYGFYGPHSYGYYGSPYYYHRYGYPYYHGYGYGHPYRSYWGYYRPYSYWL